jgi:hypothetical protein
VLTATATNPNIQNPLTNNSKVNRASPEINQIKKLIDDSDIRPAITKLRKIHKNLEKNALKVENFTASTALFEMIIGTASMLLEGKFSGDNFMYIVNSAEELLANKTKSLPESVKGIMLKGAKLLGLNIEEDGKNSITKQFENNEDRIIATYVRSLSVLGIAASSYDHIRTKNSIYKTSGTLKKLSKFASSAIMLIPALPMLATYSAKHSLADLMLKVKTKNPYANKLKLTANEDFICFNEALLLGVRKLLSNLLPNHKRIIELSASLVSSVLGVANANATLSGKETEGANNNFFNSELMTKKLPQGLYPAVQKSFELIGLKLPKQDTLNKVGTVINHEIKKINEKIQSHNLALQN